MTFLQPWLLVALPLVAMPLIIHLINQRRFQTVQWGGMMFLLAAKALSSGYSKLRHWLIMALRMLAVAAVLLGVARPLSRGWLALAGGARPDTAIVVLDRSPSMQARDPAAPATKLATGRSQLAESLATLAPQRCLIVADDDDVRELPPAALADLPAAGPLAASADIPGMLRAAYDHIRENAAGTAEIWICSDCRSNDWSLEEGGWAGLRDAFATLPQQVRFQLVAFTEPAAGNLAVRVAQARLEPRGDQWQLAVTVAVTRQEDVGPARVPLTFEIGGVTTSLELDLVGRETVLADHVLPLGRGDAVRDWGRVSIPADTCVADNEFYFVFDRPPPRVALVVAEEAAAAGVLELATSIPPSRELVARGEAVPREGLATAAWDEAAALVWQGPLPMGREAQLVEDFVARGGQVVFFPPEFPPQGAAVDSFAGVSWGDWLVHPQPVRPEQWRSDEDLLANTLSGGALPVGELEVRRSCELKGEVVSLASLSGGVPLLARVPDSRGIFFCATLPRPADSSLASEGIVLYALLQRAIDRGLEPLAGARQLAAGPAARVLLADGAAGSRWERLAGAADAVSAEAGLHAGVYAAAGRLVAVNRSAAEDIAPVAVPERIDELFRGLSYTRVTGNAGRSDSIVQEIWRAFLIAMLLALVGEGLLSLPRRRLTREPAGPSEAAA
jgi:hypothetical protein